MDEMSSAKFRKKYARLTEPTVVTVNGHALGLWTPHPVVPIPADWYNRDKPVTVVVDDLRVTLPGTFGAPRPAPKPGKR